MHDVKGGGGQDGVVIAGGGLAAQRCAETLRRHGYGGRVRMVCGEAHLPYDRPPLSKEVLGDQAAEDTVAFRAPEWYEDKGIGLLRGVGASGLDVTAHRLELADGSALHYEQLVIATGSRPRMLPAFARCENVSTLRTLEDSRALRELHGERADPARATRYDDCVLRGGAHSAAREPGKTPDPVGDPADRGAGGRVAKR